MESKEKYIWISVGVVATLGTEAACYGLYKLRYKIKRKIKENGKFEEKRDEVLNKIRGLTMDEFNELDDAYAYELYNYWMEIEGDKLMKTYGEGVSVDEIENYTQRLFDRFVDWLESL